MQILITQYLIKQIAQILQSVDSQVSNSYKIGEIKVLISIFRKVQCKEVKKKQVYICNNVVN